MIKYITDGKVLDGAGIYTFDTLEEAKEVWCFWMNIYAIEESQWKEIKENSQNYEQVSNYLKENFKPVYTSAGGLETNNGKTLRK